ncbi:shikimate kinase [Geomonas sp. Red276]
MNLVLIGYRGTGKSRVGRLLAQRLGMSRVAMDEEIERKAGKTTPEIVAEGGWPKFRDLESEVARELAGRDGLVIDTGGGVIERPENMEVLSADALVVWMKASVETIVSRIKGGTHRPALVDGKSFTEEVAEVLQRRTPLYEKAADVEIDTDGLAPEAIAARIIEAWKERVG